MKANVNKQVKAAFKYLKESFLWLSIMFAFNSTFAQNVGIGTDTPKHKLEVAGNIKGNSIFSSGFIGVGTTAPIYKMQVVDGSFAIENTVDNFIWSMNYSSGSNGLSFNSGGVTSRLIILNTGNVGIGITAPAYKLDVNGSIHAETTATIDGNLTVNNGKGVVYNVHGPGQVKYYTRTATATISLPGFGSSQEFTIGIQGGIFTNPPKVFVGDIVSTGGTVGELYRIQLVIYDVTTTSCKAKLINTSPNAVNYSTTWNIVCLGE